MRAVLDARYGDIHDQRLDYCDADGRPRSVQLLGDLAARLAAGAGSDRVWIAPGRRGQPMALAAFIKSVFSEPLAAIGLRFDRRIHRCRHTFVSLVSLQPGITEKEIQHRVGHGHPSSTARYRHVFRAQHDKPADVLAQLTGTPAQRANPSSNKPPHCSTSTAIRPERFARLVTLASILIESGRSGRLPYGDSFARPARLLPVEAKALVAAIDLIGEHIPEGSLASVRRKVVAALGEDPADEGLQFSTAAGDDEEIARVLARAIAARRLVSFEYYKENEDEFSTRLVEPYALINGREGWYLASFDPARDSVRHFRLDRIKSATVTDERFQARSDVDPAPLPPRPAG